ncbi:S-layer homology domain-containing protein [Cohnella suwonensis]|uniref:S-layer homology domain-containing protein n=1 Tax=Cohnella suwonensis TaxID=696072 RepID=A0ABW0LTA2_9BACL
MGNKAAAIILAMLLVWGAIPGLLAPREGKAYAADMVQVWETAGDAGFSAGNASYTSSFVYDGTPYVAYKDGANRGRVTVKKYESGSDSWVTVGSSGFSAGQASETSLFVYNGIPYVAYKDGGNSSRATVMKYDGSNWVTVGSAGFSTGTASSTSLYVYNGTPYVAYMDGGNSSRAAVKKYDGSNWVTVGSDGFSSGGSSYTTLFVYNGTPYVAYTDAGYGYRTTVKKYNGSDWETVGGEGFTTGATWSPSLYVYDGTPYVAYSDGGNSWKAEVMKYDGSSWVNVGDAGFSAGTANGTSLYVYDGNPYVAYSDGGNSWKATVMKYDGSSWATVGSAGFSEDEAAVESLYVYEGIPYVAYEDHLNKATVMRLNTAMASPGLTADTTDLDQSHDIEITFTDDAAWRAAITKVKDNTTSRLLTEGTDYTLSEGKLTIKAGVLAEEGDHKIVIRATGCANATVVQTMSSVFAQAGTADDPYLIATAGQLYSVRNHLDAGFYFKLTSDIDLSRYAAGEGWLPIGDGNKPFKGNMDGNGYVITGLTIHRLGSNDYVGLFGYANNAGLSNMKLINVNVTGIYSVGGLVGLNSSGTISGSFVTGSVSGTSGLGSKVGGLVGNSSGTISDSYAAASVSGETSYSPIYTSSIGGMVGTNNGTISDSYATGSVEGSSRYVGGLVGYTPGGTISGSYAAGPVTVTSSQNVGGLVGYTEGGTISNSFYDKDTTGQTDTGKGDGQSTEELKTQSTYTEASWDFDSVWGIHSQANNGYPYLQALAFTVTYNSNGGTAENSQPVAYGGTATEPVAPTKTDYTFRGWYADSGLTTAFDFATPITKDTTLYAKWTANRLTVSFESNGGTAVSSQTVTYESVATEPEAPTRTGYTFGGWHADSGLTTAFDFAAPITADTTIYAQWFSTNAMLSGLSVDQGTLSPSFTPSNLNYNVDLDYAMSSLNVSFVQADPAQTVSVTGAVYQTVTGAVYTYQASGLTVGSNPIRIGVTAQDGTENVYTVTVNRASGSNADLSGLALSSGTLSPGFASGTTAYAAGVANGISSLTVTPTASDSRAAITINGQSVISGQPSGAINLAAGDNPVTIEVTARDGTKKTYTVTVNRASSSSGSGGGGSGDVSPITSKDGKLTLPAGRTGEVSLDNAIVISIPTGASSKQLDLTIEIVSNTQSVMSNGEILSSPVYELLKNFSENFSKPVTLTLSFDQAKVKSGQTVAVFYYDEAKKIWVKVEGGKINGNRISAEVDHFTKFTVLVVDGKTGLAVTEETPTETPTEETTDAAFRDVAGHWAEASIKQAVSTGFVAGYADGTFKPNRTVTRAEFAVMLVRALKLQGEGAELSFTDTKEIGAWARQAVALAVQAGIIKGFNDGTFRPNAEITRSEMAAMIAGALELPIDANAATGFADDKQIPKWAKGAVDAIQKQGLVKGKGSGEFDPSGKTTRAEAVTVLLNMTR